MGGYVKIGIRDISGNLHANEVYTSAISAFFDNFKFYHLDPLHERQFLVDYESDDKTFAPTGYGLVVGDHIGKKIYTMQGYTSLCKEHVVSLLLALQGGVLTDDDTEDDYQPHLRFKGLHQHGLVSKKVTPTRTSRGIEYVITDDKIGEKSIDEIFNTIMDGKASERADHGVFIIDGGYEVISYNENVGGYTQMFADLQDAGFVFDEDSNDLWASAIAEKLSEVAEYNNEEDAYDAYASR